MLVALEGRQAITIAEKITPDIVLMDIGLPDLNGIEATRRIVGESGGSKVIAFSMYTSNHYVTEMLKAGVSGYIHKSADIDEVIEAIGAAAHRAATIRCTPARGPALTPGSRRTRRAARGRGRSG